MICKKCGKEIKDTAKFCYYCGSVNISAVYAQAQNVSVFVKRNRSLKSEIMQSAGLFVIPFLYLAWQIVGILTSYIMSVSDYEFINTYIDVYLYCLEAFILFGCALLGLALGGLAIATQRCSEKYKWVYIIPICLLEIYFIAINLDRMADTVNSILDMSEIFVAIGIAAAMKNTPPGKENSKKSIVVIAAVVTAGSTLAYRVVYTLLFRFVFYGRPFLDVWDILPGIASTIGAVIAPAILSKVIRKTDDKK